MSYPTDARKTEIDGGTKPSRASEVSYAVLKTAVSYLGAGPVSDDKLYEVFEAMVTASIIFQGNEEPVEYPAALKSVSDLQIAFLALAQDYEKSLPSSVVLSGFEIAKFEYWARQLGPLGIFRMTKNGDMLPGADMWEGWPQ